MTRTPAETREIEPLTNDEAEAVFITLVTMLDKMGCAPAATIDAKSDKGVSFRLHFGAERARKLTAAWNHCTPAEPLADGEMIEKVAAAMQKARDEIGATEQQSIAFGYAEAAMREALSAYNTNDRLREALEECVAAREAWLAADNEEAELIASSRNDAAHEQAKSALSHKD